MTNTQALAITTPATGLQLYDTTNNKNLLYNGTLWQNIATETWVAGQGYLTTAPTLAQVTTAGNTTTSDITVGGINSTWDYSLSRDSGSANTRLGRFKFIRSTYNPTGVSASIDFWRGGSAYEGILAFSTNPGSSIGDTSVERMRITDSGNVLIGTTTDAGYKLDVNGTFRASSGGGILDFRSTGFTYVSRMYLTGDFLYNSSNQPSLGIGGRMSMVSNTGIDFQWQNFVQGQFNFTATASTNNSIASPKNSFIVNHTFTDGASSSLSAFKSMVILDNINMTTFPLTTYHALYINPTVVAGTTNVIGIEVAKGKVITSASVTALSALAQGVYFNNTLVAAANNDVLVGLDINPTFTNGAFTGVANYALRLGNNQNMLLRGEGMIYHDSGSSRILVGTDAAGIYLGYNFGSRQIHFGSGGTGNILFRSSGNVVLENANSNLLVGTTTNSGYKLDVNGSARVGSLGLYGDNGTITAPLIRFNGSNKVNVDPQGYGTFTNDSLITGNYILASGGGIRANGGFGTKAGSSVISTPFMSYGISRPDADASINTLAGMGGVHDGASAWYQGLGLVFYTSSGSDISGGSFLTEKMRLSSVGNLGIGTTNPTSKLYLDGGLFTKKYYTDTANNTINFGSAYELFGTLHASSGYSFFINPTGWASGWDFNIGNATTYFNFNQSSGFSAFKVTTTALSLGGGHLSFYVSSPDTGWSYTSANGWDFVIRGSADEKLRIKSGGNVLIGTSTDSGYKLDVNGTMRVSGNVDIGTSAASSTITLPQSTGWTDFVLTNYNQANTGVRFRNPTGTRSVTIGGANLDLTGSGIIQGGTLKAGNLTLTYTTISGFNNAQLDLNGDNVILNSRPNTASPIRILNGNAGASSKGTVYISDYSNLATAVNASASLQVDSTVQGFLPPRLTTTQKNAITTPATGLEVYDSTTNTPNYYNGTTWVGVASNQSTGLSPGLFAQTSDSTPVVNTTVETTLISTGVGTLTVPANQFQVGASYIAYLSGVMSSQNNATMEIHLRSNGFILADTSPMTLSAATGKFWELHVNFTIRAIGGGGVAAIVTSGRFSYNKNAGNNPESVGFSSTNNTTFDTTINNTLVINARWGSASPLDSIYTKIFNLYRVY